MIDLVNNLDAKRRTFCKRESAQNARRLRERGAQTLSVAVVTYMTTVFVSPARRPLFERIAMGSFLQVLVHASGGAPHLGPSRDAAAGTRGPQSAQPEP